MAALRLLQKGGFHENFHRVSPTFFQHHGVFGLQTWTGHLSTKKKHSEFLLRENSAKKKLSFFFRVKN